MLIPLPWILRDFKIQIHGVLHVGAHYGQEYLDYARAGIENMIFFEPCNANYKELLKVVPNTDKIKTYKVALGNEVGSREMFVESSNMGQSNSLLEPGTHLTTYPSIVFDKRETICIIKLDMIEFDRSIFNMINMDVQGFELEVLKGAIETLPFIDIIYTEINTEQVYKGCVEVTELDEFLSKFGFSRVLTDLAPKSWGDALYLKQKNN